MIPRVLALGPWHPDTNWRFLVDGFVYAGCSVVRVGPQFFDGFPNDVLPPVYTFGLFDRAIEGLPKTFSFRQVLDECRRREWRPDLCVYQEIPNMPPTDEMPHAVPVVPADVSGFADWSKPEDIFSANRLAAIQILEAQGFEHSTVPRLWF